MKQRSPVVVWILSLVTFGIYGLVWLVSTKEEMNAQGASIPTAWIMLIPFVGALFFMWKYAQGVEHVTKLSAPLAFIFFFIPFGLGFFLHQNNFNKVANS